MRRREFIAALGSAAAWPMVARGQRPKRRIGVLMLSNANDQDGRAYHAAFLDGLRQAGWNNDRVEYIDRWSAGNAAEIRKYAAELVALAPDVIVATGPASVAKMQEITSSVPIVFVLVPD